MKLAVIFLNRIEYLEDLLSAFLEIGISGSTIIDSVGMGHIISQNIPIFAGLKDTFAGSSPIQKTILTLVEDDMISRIDEVLADVCISIDESRAYFMVSLAIDGVHGFNKPEH
ncbi:hypothetical protein KKI24_11900 [bacterium]|nr:hypothetical protein [bacterium]